MNCRVKIRESCGDYALDVEFPSKEGIVLYFGSRRNAETVKRCIEVDVGTAMAADFVEVTRCKDCKYFVKHFTCEFCGDKDEPCGICNNKGGCVPNDGFCYYGRKK